MGSPRIEMHASAMRYERDPDENWELRPDVAGYEYPEEGHGWRIGIVRNVIESPEGLDAIKSILETPFSALITRNMARAVISGEMLKNPPAALQELLPEMEAIMSLAGSGNKDLQDCYQVIFAQNAESRRTRTGLMERETREAERAFRIGATKRARGETVRPPEGVTFQIVDASSGPEILASLFRFVHDADSTPREAFEEMLADDDVLLLVAVIEQEGKKAVVGSLYAVRDADTLYRGGRATVLSTYEIGGARVRDDLQNRNIARAMAEHLLCELAGRKDAQVVFGHSNARRPGIFSMAAQLGATMATETARELGLPLRPLQQAVGTGGEMVDEIACYATRDRLIELYGSAAK